MSISTVSPGYLSVSFTVHCCLASTSCSTGGRKNFGCVGPSLPSLHLRSWKRGAVVCMAPEEEKMTRRSPLDFPIEWERPKPGRRPDIFPRFSPMKTPLPTPFPADPPEEDEEEEEEKKEEEEGDPEKEDPEKPEKET